MDIKQFAEQHRLKVRNDECGEPIIFGRMWKNQPIPRFVSHRPASEYHYGHQIFDNGDGRLGVVLMFDSPAKWTFAEKKLIEANFVIKNSGISKGVPPFFDRYGEGIALFDPANKVQVRLALKLTGARIRKVLSPEQKATLAVRLLTARQAKTV